MSDTLTRLRAAINQPISCSCPKAIYAPVPECLSCPCYRKWMEKCKDDVFNLALEILLTEAAAREALEAQNEKE